jgi:Ca2+-binding RTX toxin-like protein
MLRARPPLGVLATARSLQASVCTLGAASSLAFLPAPAHAAAVIGTPAPDTLVASSPTGDLLYGGGGADTLIGGVGNDVIFGMRSGNTIDAGAGDNYVEGGTGDDLISGGSGRNTVYGGTGHDTITLGDGDNYVDPGGAPDVIVLGNGNNVVNGGSGGMDLRAGGGSNTVYSLSGPDSIVLGGGINHVYVAGAYNYLRIDCGGNPASVLHVSSLADPGLTHTSSAVEKGKVVGCPNIVEFDGQTRTVSRSAQAWERFALVGTDGPDKLYGGHGGGTIDGGGGDNVLWADWIQDTGGPAARANTTRITATDGDNIVFGGRGTNLIRVGDGRNFVRGGAWNNRITVGRGYNTIRLQGYGRNKVKIRGGRAYVESFANGHRPSIRCLNGARATIVYGNTRPKTNCDVVANARSSRGKQLQLQGLEPTPDSDPVVLPAPAPGVAAGVPRPDLSVYR